MKDYVWISHGHFSVPKTHPLRSREFLLDEPREEYLENLRAMKRGDAVPAEKVPKALYCQKGADVDHLEYLNVAGEWVVNAEVADIFRGFDLGDGGLYPVDIFKSDMNTPLKGEYFILVFGNKKTSVSEEHSTLRKKPSGFVHKYSDPDSAGGEELVLLRDRVIGPDVWKETELPFGYMFSQELGDALVAAKKHQRFRLDKCRVI